MGHEMGHYVLGHAPIIRRSASASNSATAIIRGGKALRCATGLDSGAERVRHESDPLRATPARNAVEELDDAGLERVLGADDQQAVVAGSAARGSPSRGAGGRPRRGCWRARPAAPAHRGRAAARSRAAPSTDGRTRSTIERRLRDWSSRRPLQLFERGQDRAALRVPEHDDQPRAEPRGGELDAADLRRRDDVAGDADDEQIAEPLIEDDLGRHARVGAAEDDRERLLPASARRGARGGDRGAAPIVGDEAAVALAGVRALFALKSSAVHAGPAYEPGGRFYFGAPGRR